MPSITGKLGHSVKTCTKPTSLEMTCHAYPSSQFEQFTIDQGAQITITRIDVFRMTVDARLFDSLT